MEFNNKTIVILGLIALGLFALFMDCNDLALAFGSGLVGYLSKDSKIILNGTTEVEDEDNEEISGEDSI